MSKFIGFSAILSAMLLAACGGGGGSPGENTLPYSISLRADKTQLPLNPGHEFAGQGVYAPYTTTLYVEARQGGMLIPGGEEVFACNVAQGLDSGFLYYLDGDDDHEDDDGNPLAYRSIVLGANSGGNSFHFHAWDKAGVARITCSVTDPRDGRVHAASVDITVGGTTNKPSNVLTTVQAPGYLGWQNNVVGVPNSVVVQARVFDDLNQPVSGPAGANVSVKILPVSGSVYAGARLMAGNQSRGPNEELWAATVGGVTSFMLASGPDTGTTGCSPVLNNANCNRSGTIVLELTVDRLDNDVTNGISDPIRSLMAINVVNGVTTSPLSINGANLTATVGADVVFALSANGGVPPYRWSFEERLPAGLGLRPDGIIVGSPLVVGTTNMVIVVTDNTNNTVRINIPVTVEAPEEE